MNTSGRAAGAAQLIELSSTRMATGSFSLYLSSPSTGSTDPILFGWAELRDLAAEIAAESSAAMADELRPSEL